MSKGCAVVTGVSRGIGRAIAIRLAASGYDIAGCSRGAPEALADVAESLRAHGIRTYLAPCDVSKLTDVQQFVADTERTLGPITVLVNNAGIVKDNPIVLMQEPDWEVVIQTNLKGTWNFCHVVTFRFMKRRAGVIINLSSVAGVYGSATQTNYAASKAGIIGLSRSLAKEVARYGIRVNVVAPGFIETDMTAPLDDKRRAKALDAIPLGRFGSADDVAEVVEFLASERAAYVTGQVLQVDGGIAI